MNGRDTELWPSEPKHNPSLVYTCRYMKFGHSELNELKLSAANYKW